MSEKIEPALSAEEWEGWKNGVGIDLSDDETAYAAVWQNEEGLGVLSGDSWDVYAHGQGKFVRRKALAALALHEQPFGFTLGDWYELKQTAANDHLALVTRECLTSLAERIEALLPPEKEEP